MIEKGGEKGSGISVLMAQHNDDDDDDDDEERRILSASWYVIKRPSSPEN